MIIDCSSLFSDKQMLLKACFIIRINKFIADAIKLFSPSYKAAIYDGCRGTRTETIFIRSIKTFEKKLSHFFSVDEVGFFKKLLYIFCFFLFFGAALISFENYNFTDSRVDHKQVLFIIIS
jgi:hypothetical protein